MDPRLVGWAGRVKARRRSRVPALLLVTARGQDPLAAAARLPRGLCAVLLRHEHDPGRAALGRALARICRARRNLLLVADDARLARALGAGLHLRRGRRGVVPARPLSSSVHNAAEARRARQAGVDWVVVSPLFPTASHPGARGLGPARWAALARRAGRPALALGGVDTGKLRLVPRQAAGLAAIRALHSPGETG